jgi:hypothetical protein
MVVGFEATRGARTSTVAMTPLTAPARAAKGRIASLISAQMAVKLARHAHEKPA